MAWADVMAITKWSILPGRLNLFIARLMLFDIVRLAGDVSSSRHRHDLEAPAHARGFLLPSVRRRVGTFAALIRRAGSTAARNSNGCRKNARSCPTQCSKDLWT